MPLDVNYVYCMDALDGLKELPDNSVQLVVTSPPYSNIRQSYPGPSAIQFVNWFLPFSKEILRVLTSDGSFILNIKDKAENGERIPYAFETVIQLRSQGYKFVDNIVWGKKNGSPNAGRRRADYFEYIFHFAKTTTPVWNPDEIRTPYPETTIKRAQKPIKRNVSNRESRLATEDVEYKDWILHEKGAYPKNLIFFPKDSGKNHVASFHVDLPTHFIKAHSNPGSIIVDPFSGRGTTCQAARLLNRQFIGFEILPEHVQLAKTVYDLPIKI